MAEDEGLCHGCVEKTVDDCIECIKQGQCSCNIWPVIKDVIQRIEILEINQGIP
jgi:hypothetical protein